MAGSYKHVVDSEGRLLRPEDMMKVLGNGGDIYEAIEEMYGMIWFIALHHGGQDPRVIVEDAQRNYNLGLRDSPGTLGELSDD